MGSNVGWVIKETQWPGILHAKLHRWYTDYYYCKRVVDRDAYRV